MSIRFARTSPPWAVLLARTLVLVGAGCVELPAEQGRNGFPSGSNGTNDAAAAYNQSLDGAAGIDVGDVGVFDTAGLVDSQVGDTAQVDDGVQDADDTGANDSSVGDDSASVDSANADSTVADANGDTGGDTGSSDAGGDAGSDADTTPSWPTGTLKVESAFSPDGVGVRVRFNKPPTAATAICATATACAKVYTIQGSNASTVPVLAAALAADPRFVALSLDPTVKINPSLTYTALAKGLVALDGELLDGSKRKAIVKRTVYLHLLFHQHQPTYEDPIAGQLTSPWVRKHATKDYYDMASRLLPFPDVHLTMNLTSVLLAQLQSYYVERLGPFVDTKANKVDTAAFLAKWKGKTDPWIDLLLEPSPTPQAATEKQLGLLYADPWSCVSTSPVLMKRFPDYAALRDKNPATLTQQDYLGLKIWFELAWMDPDFLVGPVKLATGETVDLTDVITAKSDGTFALKVPLSEALANRIVAEEYKIMAAVVPIHKQMAYQTELGSKGQPTGQIELTTTPYYHPILPLVQDTNLMSQGQPFDPKPAQTYAFPSDAAAQVGRAVAYFDKVFGFKPRGMWPGEGSVAEDVVQHFVKHGVRWVATDQQVMEKSGQSPGGAPVGPFMVDVDKQSGDAGDASDELGVFFRNTNQSNDIGFKYQGLSGEDAANDLIKNVTSQAPVFGAADRVITLILDGENAWETFAVEHDGVGFFQKLYDKLSVLQESGELITVTGSEYIDGNPTRNVPPHPLTKLPELEPLFPGSWIGGNFAVWIGESEENAAWGYLLTARKALQASGLAQPDPYTPAPNAPGTLDHEIWYAWDEMYAAEGSDWFWWYGADMTSPSNDDSPFDQAFRTHLAGMYKHMNAALKLQGKAEIALPDFKPLIQATEQVPPGPFTTPPVLDGKLLPNESEWGAQGGFFFDSDTNDAQANPDDWIATVFYGWDDKGLYLGVQHNFDLSNANGELLVYLGHKHIVDAKTGQFQEDPALTTGRGGLALAMKGKGAARELRVVIGGGKATPEWRKSDGSTAWESTPTATFNGAVGGPVAGGKLIEILLPWSDLGLVKGDPIEVRLAYRKNGKNVDTAPTLESKYLVEDATNAIFCTFEVDVSESAIKLDLFGWIETFPPPKGKGIVYITGNHPKLGMKTKWVPNKVALRDDGQEGDKVAGDKIWTGVFDFPRGTSVRYKYTVGLPKDEGKWGGTEEFPLTERGLEVTKDPSKSKMRIQDIFADRPQPSGTSGQSTKITQS